MARSLASKVNVQAPDSDYPYARIKDNNGTGNGTPVNENTYGDFHQFFAKMFAESGLTYNGLPDNEYSGFQFYKAFIRCAVPVGIVSMWSGAPGAIPDNYQLCDGAAISDAESPLNGNNTPNLKGKFIVGYDSADADYDAIGDTGGEKTHTLSATESGVPAHTHASPAHSHGIDASDTTPPNGAGPFTHSNAGSTQGNYYSSQAVAVTISANTAAAAADAHENRPPYYTLAYIIKIK